MPSVKTDDVSAEFTRSMTSRGNARYRLVETEMERDAVIAHGLAKFLKERLMDCSDAYSTYVCGKCGMFARREESRLNEPKPGPDDVFYCPMCNNYTDIHQIMIPYAFKLMLQELMAMNIAPRIRVQKHLIV